MMTRKISNFRVTSDTRHSGIQKAISSAKDGDIIEISRGTYHENLLINKEITLMAEEPGEVTLMPIDVRRPSIMIVLSGEDQHVVLNGMFIFTSSTGIEVLGSESQKVTIKENKILGYRDIQEKVGVGIRLLGGIYVSIYDNRIGHLSIGILMNGRIVSRIKGNQIFDNHDGILFKGRSRATVIKNQISNNENNGITMMGTDVLNISQNEIMNNKGWGIYLENQLPHFVDVGSKNAIKGSENTFFGNQMGNLYPKDVCMTERFYDLAPKRSLFLREK